MKVKPNISAFDYGLNSSTVSIHWKERNFFAVVLRPIGQYSREMIFLILRLDLGSYFLSSYSLNLTFTDTTEVKLA